MGRGARRGLLLSRKTTGNDKGCKYLLLLGPGSCAELTGPLLGCWGMERECVCVGGLCVCRASEVGSVSEKRALEDQLGEKGRMEAGVGAQQITQLL